MTVTTTTVTFEPAEVGMLRNLFAVGITSRDQMLKQIATDAKAEPAFRDSLETLGAKVGMMTDDDFDKMKTVVT